MAGPIGKRVWRTDDGAHLPFVVDDGGNARICGVLRPRPRFGGAPKWAAANPVFPRSQWVEVDYSNFDMPILDQGETGSCVGHGTATAFGRTWKMDGRSYQAFSACYIYGKINGGVDQGAIVGDAAALLTTGGDCLESTVPEGMIYASQFPRSADAEAANCKVQGYDHLATFDEIASVLLMARLPVFGIMVGDNFSNLNSDGVPPVGGNGGHCLTGVGLVKLRSGRWAIKTQNSWGAAWGMAGFCHLIEPHFVYGMQAYGGVDAFAIRATIDPPDDPDNPPVMVA